MTEGQLQVRVSDTEQPKTKLLHYDAIQVCILLLLVIIMKDFRPRTKTKITNAQYTTASGPTVFNLPNVSVFPPV